MNGPAVQGDVACWVALGEQGLCSAAIFWKRLPWVSSKGKRVPRSLKSSCSSGVSSLFLVETRMGLDQISTTARTNALRRI
jgi:hypothetical protein